MQNVPYAAKGGADHHKAERFGDHITGDAMALHGLKNRGVHGEPNAIVIRDVATDFVDTFPCKSRTVEDAHASFLKFQGPRDKIKYWYSDKAPELRDAAVKMEWALDGATPGMPWTNGLAESSVKSILHGNRACLMGAGLLAKYRPYATKYANVAFNTDSSADISPWAKRHGTEFDGWRFTVRMSH